jgi:murein L,D-transpeptidase YafK
MFAVVHTKMKNTFTIICIVAMTTQVISQSRKDLVSEYKKFLLNESHLGIILNGNVNNFTNEEIRTVLDSAWVKKKSIILLQLLGYLENPVCGLLMLSDIELETALLQFKRDNDLYLKLKIGDSLNQVLLNKYINSKNKQQLPYLVRKNLLDYEDMDILFVVYKSELEFQVWAKKKFEKSSYTLIKSFPITDPKVAKLGPKSKYGDSLTPEGVYSIYFYPSFRWSDFHLAFGISYPNRLDHARRFYWNITEKAGGDINIHGFCISIGCIPLGNPIMDEVFFLTRANLQNGADISIMIFPFKFDDEDVNKKHYNEFRTKPRIRDFWQSLEDCHKYFKRYEKIPEFVKNPNNGYYILSDN